MKADGAKKKEEAKTKKVEVKAVTKTAEKVDAKPAISLETVTNTVKDSMA